MFNKSFLRLLFLSSLLLFVLACSQQKNASDLSGEEEIQKIKTQSKTSAENDAIKIRSEVAVEIADGLELSLWASDTLVNAPIAISIDEDGKMYYTKATRQSNSEFDIRGHRNWMTESISFETVEDRRAFLRKTFSADSEESEKFLQDLNKDGVKDWKDLAVEKEEVWAVEDTDQDGHADKAVLYIKDFHEEVTDVANGVEAFDGNVYVSVAPDLWKTTDTDGDGFADTKESISHGYGIHIGFSGHGMSGVTVGPDGRLYWGIGDIGANITDKEGNKWEYPNQGVIVRSEPDGSNFEVYAAGVRNTHEFVFDKYGNLITEDNDGDHRGERERLMYVINGMDAGWRSNWQYGKYTDPNNNGYKVWMDEMLSVPRWSDQAAYIIPPIQNYVNGPTGMVYNPGTALGEEWYEHFFIAEFRGNPANSPVHAFTLNPKGAGFTLKETQPIVSGLLPTGMDFGPDGALYFSDWIDGWSPQQLGRVWKVDVADGGDQAMRAETKKLIQTDFSTLELTELGKYLGHQDMRIRRKAQFELVKKGSEGYEVLVAAAGPSNDQLTRIHGIWGIAQAARMELNLASPIANYLQDEDPEIRAQAVKMLGDVKYTNAGDAIIPLLKDESDRVKMLAAEALGRLKHDNAKEALIGMLLINNDRDVYIRHAGSFALSRIGDADILVQQKNHHNKGLRLASVVALRRMRHPGAAEFLNDVDQWVVTETARAIHDDKSIPAAMPALANSLNTSIVRNEAFLRRAINANFRLGQKENIDNLIAFIQNPQAPEVMRAEAMACIGTWSNPSPLDRVTGRNRGLSARDGSYAKEKLKEIADKIGNRGSGELLKELIIALKKLGVNDKSDLVESIFNNSNDPIAQQEALVTLNELGSENIDAILEKALSSSDSDLRSKALSIIPESSVEESKAVDLFGKIINSGNIQEKQTAISSLSNYSGSAAIEMISSLISKISQGEVEPEIELDILEAGVNNGNEALKNQVDAYYAAKGDNDLAMYEECLTGGDVRNGRNIFYRNEAAQCVRCHSIFEWGGDAGPGLQGIANKLDNTQLLEAIVYPSKRLAPGYGVLSVELNDGTTTVGVLEEETDDSLILKVSKDDRKTVLKADVKTQSFIPSSMPDMKNILDKKEIRDVVAFLASLKGEEQ